MLAHHTKLPRPTEAICPRSFTPARKAFRHPRQPLQVARATIPKGPQEMVSQAVDAVLAGYQDGHMRQKLEILLPLIGATDLDDWPGGIRQQFTAAQPLVELMLRRLKQTEGLQGPLVPEVWDEGDAVIAYKGSNLSLVVFPNANTLKKVRQLAEGTNACGLLLLVNPQWNLAGGQLIPELGFGEARRQSEAWIGSLHDSYTLRQLRILGDDIRVLRVYPGKWQVLKVDRRGAGELLAELDAPPSYQDVEQLLKGRADSSMNKSLLQRLQDEWKFNADSLKGPN